MLSTRPTVASPPKLLAPTDVVTRASKPSARSRSTSRSRTASLAGLPSGRGCPAIAVTVSIARAALKLSAGTSAGSGAGGRAQGQQRHGADGDEEQQGGDDATAGGGNGLGRFGALRGAASSEGMVSGGHSYRCPDDAPVVCLAGAPNPAPGATAALPPRRRRATKEERIRAVEQMENGKSPELAQTSVTRTAPYPEARTSGAGRDQHQLVGLRIEVGASPPAPFLECGVQRIAGPKWAWRQVLLHTVHDRRSLGG